MATQNEIVSQLLQRIEFTVDKFRNASPTTEARIMNKFQILLKELDLNARGEVKASVRNLRVVNRIMRELRLIMLESSWGTNVRGLEEDIQRIQNLQVRYFKTIEQGYTATKFMEEVSSNTIKLLQTNLLGDGLNINVVNKIGDLLRKNITESVTFSQLVQEMSDFIKGNQDHVGILQRYSSQIVNDSLNQYAAELNKVFTDDLGLQWYRYVGSIVKDSRPWCVAMVRKQFVHESELNTVCNGNIDGQRVSLKGLIVGTDALSVQINRGGYNCAHLLLPVSEESVPQTLRDKIFVK